MMTIIWLMSLVWNSHDGLEPTDRLIPPGYTGNPWGPEATRARETGVIPPVPVTPVMAQWYRWGKTVLKDGDILFRRGDAKILHGHFPFSRFIAGISGSQFSHTGIASIENGEVFVYDTTKAGVRRQPFCVWILDNAGPFGVKRVKPEYQAYAAKAVAFCRDSYYKQVPFDFELKDDDRAFYCVEMSEKAYRRNGLPLAEPVKLGDMENITKYPFCVMAFMKVSDLSLEQPVFFPGNERHGIWSSPKLMTVYSPPPTPPKPITAVRAVPAASAANTVTSRQPTTQPVGRPN